MEKACCNVESDQEEKRDEGVPNICSNTFNFPLMPEERSLTTTKISFCITLVQKLEQIRYLRMCHSSF